jgi:hypothetical protein
MSPAERRVIVRWIAFALTVSIGFCIIAFWHTPPAWWWYGAWGVLTIGLMIDLYRVDRR